MHDWLDWVHVTCTTRGTWLPGDPRGFRDHDHRVHSQGDAHRLPPEGQHARLHAFARRINRHFIRFDPPTAAIIAHAMITKLDTIDIGWRVIAVAPTHVHTLIRAGEGDARPVFGRVKQAASRRVHDRLPGAIWTEGCGLSRITSPEHYRSVTDYILAHEREGAIVIEHPSIIARRERRDREIRNRRPDPDPPGSRT